MRTAALLLLVAGCSSAVAPPEPAGVEAIYGEPSATVLTPYPSDRYAVADAQSATGLRVHIVKGGTTDLVQGTGLEPTLAELNEHDGFSSAGGLIVTFSGPIDVTRIAKPADGTPPPAPLMDAAAFAQPSSPIVLVDVDPKSPEKGKARGLVPRYWEQPKDDYYLHDEFTLVAQPSEPLLPRTRYLFAVTDALKAADGGKVRRSAMMAALLAGSPAGPYATEIADGLKVLEGFGVSRDRVMLASAFTTMTVREPSIAMMKEVRAIGTPKLLKPWTVETPATPPDKRVRLRAVYESPDFRAGDERFKLDAQGAPIVQSKAGLEVFLAVSDATSQKRRPVVIFQHGLGGDKDGSWGASERLAPLDAAVFAIDSPHHGSRADDPANPSVVAATFSFFGISIKDKSFVIGKARDNFRQMAADQLGLVALIESLKDADLFPPGAPDGKPDFDTTRILYIGHSFGSVQGATIFAMSPEIGAAVWNVGGDVLTTLLRDSPTFAVLINTLRPPGISDGEIARFFAVIQAIVDPGDPINYARYCAVEAMPGVDGWKPRDVLVQEVIDDNIVPNSTSEALARAAHLTLIDPIRPVSGVPSGKSPLSANLATGATAVMSQFDVMNGTQTATHGELYFSTEGVAQYVSFFKSALSGAHATVQPSYPKK